MAVVALILILLFSAVILGKGWAGRRVGDAPHCKACRFDLSGRASDAERCPECGARLTSDAVVMGERVRRWRLAVAGGLGMCLSLSGLGLAYSGKLSKASLMAALPADVLVTVGVDRPISSAAQYELDKRAQNGRLDAREQRRLADALLTAIPNASYEHIGRLGRLLSALANRAGIAPAVRRDIADFLIARWRAPDESWVLEWTDTLGRLHNDGFVDAVDWDAIVTDALTPRLYTVPHGQLAPGERLLVGVRFDDRCPRELLFDATARLQLPPEVGIDWDNHVNFGHRSPLDVQAWEARDGRAIALIAPAVTGRFEITASVEYTPRGSVQWVGTPTPHTGIDAALIEVASVDEGGNDKLSWLRSALLPCVWGRNLSPIDRWHDFDIIIPVVCELRAYGRLLAITQDGTRIQLGHFQTDGGRAMWSESGTGGTTSGTNSAQTPSSIRLAIPAEYVLPSSSARLVLAFDTVSFPDGRSHAGPEPIEIDLPWDRRLLRPLW